MANRSAVRDQVELRAPTQRIQCARLSAVLAQPIDLSSNTFPQVALDRIEAGGGVRLENRTLGAQGVESMDSAQVASVTIYHKSGEFRGAGPGWLETVRYGSKGLGNAFAGGQFAGAQPNGGTAAPAANQQEAPQLIYLRVAFQGGIEGNIQKRQVDFVDRVQGIYGPVTRWNERIEVANPRMLPANALMMHCDRLSVFQIMRRFNNGLPIEIAATGKVAVEGAQFAAKAHRMSYDQAKGQIVLEGDGRTDATLWRQGNGNGLETSAAKVQFWPDSNRVNVDGFRKLEFGEG